MNDCSAKTFYATKADARRAKKGIRKRFHSSIKFYKCPYCEGWHLTTSKNNLEKQLESIDLQCAFKEMIQSGQAEFVRRISQGKTIWRVVVGEKGYNIIYNNKTKVSKINYYFSVKL